MSLPQYDEVHIISDLHMGGTSGGQILRETKRLAKYIDEVHKQCPAGRVALVLNGDVVDTLAEKGIEDIAVDNAVTIITEIMKDESFKPIWSALAEFVKSAGRTLIIILGNHDLELSFPEVQRLLVKKLAGDDPLCRSRIEFSTMGAGYACLVGEARVFCTHGNEVDAWNYVRYEELSRLTRRLNAGRSLKASEWKPNAGTMMVKDVINEVKVKYPWIDLLKPERKGAIGALLALDRSQAEKIIRLLPLVGELIIGSLMHDQRLSAEGFAVPDGKPSRPITMEAILGDNLLAGLQRGGGRSRSTADAMLRAVEKEYKNGNAVTDLHDDTLGGGQLAWDWFKSWFTDVDMAEALRLALLDWQKDRTFAIDNRDEECEELLATVGDDIHFIVSGHTHLERAIALGNGRFYFNCGTWIRLLRFTDEMLKDEDSFKPVCKLLLKCTMAKIDEAVFDDEPFVLDQCSAVSIKKEGGRVVGRLVHIDAAGKPVAPAIKEFER